MRAELRRWPAGEATVLIREQGGRTPDTHRTTNNGDTDRVAAARTSRAAVRRRMLFLEVQRAI